jgi:prevent-host-death family protein
MTIIKIHDAKTNLSKLIARAEAGEEIIIARGDKPVVRIEPLNPAKKNPRIAGALAHLGSRIPDNLFLEPLSDDELNAWEGKESYEGDN